jgi:hypothetical protein
MITKKIRHHTTSRRCQRQYKKGLAALAITILGTYTLTRGNSGSYPSMGLPQNDHFFSVLPVYLGLYDTQGRVRPTYYALKFLSLMRGEKLAITGTEIKGPASRSKGAVHLVFWNFPEREGKAHEINVVSRTRKLGHSNWCGSILKVRLTTSRDEKREHSQIGTGSASGRFAPVRNLLG